MKDRRRPFTTTLPVEVLRELADVAKELKTTRTDIIERALAAYEALRSSPPRNS